jgi:K+/H+ antiporter YhaU regulatory subunit KhtT
MDLYKTIAELRARRDQLARIIAQLEELQVNPGPQSTKRRGRKFMGPKERAEVSKRMKLYWANRAKRQKERATSTS